MAHAVLLRRVELGRRARGTLDDEQRVVAESAAAARHPADPPVPARLADDRRRVAAASAGRPSRSGSAPCARRRPRFRVRAAACGCWPRRRPARPHSVPSRCPARRAARRPRGPNRRRWRAGRKPRPQSAPSGSRSRRSSGRSRPLLHCVKSESGNTSTCHGERIARISRSLPALPVARTSRAGNAGPCAFTASSPGALPRGWPAAPRAGRQTAAGMQTWRGSAVRRVRAAGTRGPRPCPGSR